MVSVRSTAIQHMFQSAPLLRGAINRAVERRGAGMFQSAPLLRGAIGVGQRTVAFQDVSIRAPLARGDLADLFGKHRVVVSIRAPLARGDPAKPGKVESLGVSIRAPLARGDERGGVAGVDFIVSIRAPLARGDRSTRAKSSWSSCFNPRPSCEGRCQVAEVYSSVGEFQSAPLLRGAIRACGGCRGTADCFNPRPSCEGR